MKLRTRIGMAVAALTVAATAQVADSATGEANAAYNCTTWYASTGFAHAKCLTGEPGGNRYRVGVWCQHNITKASRAVYGDIKHVNDSPPSTVTGCGFLESYYGSPWAQTVWD